MDLKSQPSQSTQSRFSTPIVITPKKRPILEELLTSTSTEKRIRSPDTTTVDPTLGCQMSNSSVDLRTSNSCIIPRYCNNLPSNPSSVQDLSPCLDTLAAESIEFLIRYLKIKPEKHDIILHLLQNTQHRDLDQILPTPLNSSLDLIFADTNTDIVGQKSSSLISSTLPDNQLISCKSSPINRNHIAESRTNLNETSKPTASIQPNLFHVIEKTDKLENSIDSKVINEKEFSNSMWDNYNSNLSTYESQYDAKGLTSFMKLLEAGGDDCVIPYEPTNIMKSTVAIQPQLKESTVTVISSSTTAKKSGKKVSRISNKKIKQFNPIPDPESLLYPFKSEICIGVYRILKITPFHSNDVLSALEVEWCPSWELGSNTNWCLKLRNAYLNNLPQPKTLPVSIRKQVGGSVVVKILAHHGSDEDVNKWHYLLKWLPDKLTCGQFGQYFVDYFYAYSDYINNKNNDLHLSKKDIQQITDEINKVLNMKKEVKEKKNNDKKNARSMPLQKARRSLRLRSKNVSSIDQENMKATTPKQPYCTNVTNFTSDSSKPTLPTSENHSGFMNLNCFLPTPSPSNQTFSDSTPSPNSLFEMEVELTQSSKKATDFNCNRDSIGEIDLLLCKCDSSKSEFNNYCISCLVMDENIADNNVSKSENAMDDALINSVMSEPDFGLNKLFEPQNSK